MVLKGERPDAVHVRPRHRRAAARPPAGGARVALSAGSGSVTPPSTVTIPEGTNQIRFAVATKRVRATTPVRLTAYYDGVSKSATLTLTK
jgi:hypothetical protein